MDNKKNLLKDITKLYQYALEYNNITAALKVLELKARLEGFYTPKKPQSLSVKDLTDIDIETLIQELSVEA